MKTVFDVDEMIFIPPELGCVLYLPGLSGSGSKIGDRSPYGHFGTITGATWTKLPNGLWCLNFDGIDDQVDFGTNSNLNPTNQFSVALWLRYSQSQTNAIFLDKDALNGQARYTLRLSNNTAKFEVTGQGGTVTATGTTLLNDNRFHFIAGVRGDSKVKLAVDAREEASVDDTAGAFNWATGQSLRLGCRSTPGVYTAGTLALARICKYARSALQLQNDFNREKQLFGEW